MSYPAERPGDIWTHGVGNPPDERNFVCGDCGEELPIYQMSDVEGICYWCAPCPICKSPVVDGICQDYGDSGCPYERSP